LNIRKTEGFRSCIPLHPEEKTRSFSKKFMSDIVTKVVQQRVSERILYPIFSRNSNFSKFLQQSSIMKMQENNSEL
jgi:hypothetical protein